MIGITKLKQDQIMKILNILVSPVTNNILPVSNFFDSRYVMKKCRADDTEGIFNLKFLLQEFVDIYGINVKQEAIKTGNTGTKADEYEKHELTE